MTERHAAPYRADTTAPASHYYGRAVNGHYIPSRSTGKVARTIVRNTGGNNVYRIAVFSKKPSNAVVLGFTAIGIGLVLLLFWQCAVTPAWEHYQEERACGSNHVCTASVIVSPEKSRIFAALAYQTSLVVYELPDANNTDSHTYSYAALYLGVDWNSVTPLMEARNVQNEDYQDIVISSSDFQGGSLVLYNQGDGTFRWQVPERNK